MFLLAGLLVKMFVNNLLCLRLISETSRGHFSRSNNLLSQGPSISQQIVIQVNIIALKHYQWKWGKLRLPFFYLPMCVCNIIDRTRKMSEYFIWLCGKVGWQVCCISEYYAINNDGHCTHIFNLLYVWQWGLRALCKYSDFRKLSLGSIKIALVKFK